MNYICTGKLKVPSCCVDVEWSICTFSEMFAICGCLDQEKTPLEKNTMVYAQYWISLSFIVVFFFSYSFYFSECFEKRTHICRGLVVAEKQHAQNCLSCHTHHFCVTLAALRSRSHQTIAGSTALRNFHKVLAGHQRAPWLTPPGQMM